MTSILIAAAVLGAAALVFSVGVIVGWNRGRESAGIEFYVTADDGIDIDAGELIDLTDTDDEPVGNGWLNPRPMH